MAEEQGDLYFDSQFRGNPNTSATNISSERVNYPSFAQDELHVMFEEDIRNMNRWYETPNRHRVHSKIFGGKK